MSNERTNPGPSANVREAAQGDGDAIYALCRELAETLGDQRPDSAAVLARLGDLLEEPRARVVVAEDDESGDVVGAANLWIKPDLAHGDNVIEVPMLVVSGSARRRGIGKLLVEEIQGVAAAEDANLIELIATKDNDTARAFYKSLGFVETDHVSLEFVGSVRNPPGPRE